MYLSLCFHQHILQLSNFSHFSSLIPLHCLLAEIASKGCSKFVPEVYIAELIEDFVCNSDSWAVVGYRLSFCVQLHKHSHSKRIYGADIVADIYDLNDKFEYEKRFLLGA